VLKPWNNEARNDPEMKARFVAVAVDQIKKGWTDRGIKRQFTQSGLYKKDDTRVQAIIDEARLQSRIPDPDEPNPATAPISLEHYENFDTTVSKNWIIKNVIALGETSSWIGPPGAGKSALITDLAIHIASGMDWRGHRSKKNCGVVYFALERGELVKRRLIAHAARTKDFPAKLSFSIARQVIDLMKPICIGEIVEAINSAAEHHGCLTGMIVIDTYAKGIAASGGDENSARDQNMTLANLRRVQEATGVHIAIVGHTGKDEAKGARGSNAHLGDVDMMVQFSGEKDQRVATIIKNNDGAEGLLTRYKLEVAVLGTDEDGDAITTAIISADQMDSEKDISRAKLNKTQRKAMEMLERAIVDDGRDVPISSEYPRGAGKMVALEVWRACCIKGGLSVAGTKESADKAFRRAVSDLDAMQRIGMWEGNVWIAYE
jgi:AAA domain